MKGVQKAVHWTCGALAIGALLASTGLPSEASAAHKFRKNGAGKVELKLSFPKHEFLLAEDIAMELAVTNRTAGTVTIPDPFRGRNWQPTYTITGPSYPEGRTFSARSSLLNDPRPEPADVPAVTVDLAPGKTIEHGVPLSRWVPIGEPGAYEIVARLHWGNLSVHSEAVKFKVASPRPVSLSVGVDAQVPGSLGEWIEWLHDEGTVLRLYTALFSRPVVDQHGYVPFTISALTSAGPGATDLLVPWANYDRQSGLAKWRVWREGSSLIGFVTGMPEASRLDLGAPPSRLIRPALMTSDEALDVFAVTSAGDSLMLGRFPAPHFQGSQSPASIVWRIPVPHAPLAGRAALSPEKLGSERRVVLVGQSGEDLAVDFLNAGDGRHAGAFVTVLIPRARAISNTEPGLHVDLEGVTHFSIPILRGDNHLALADLRFGPDGTLVEEPVISDQGILEARPRAAAAGYVVSAEGAMRRDWIVILEDGRAVYPARRAPGRLLPGTPVIPLQLVLLEAGTYVLTLGPHGMPTMTLLD